MKYFKLNGREVCWDMELVEKAENVRLNLHKPTRRNVALRCDAPWEDFNCGYPHVIKFGDKYRIYYRAICSMNKPNAYCVAESVDGITFARPQLCMFEYEGSNKNNIFHMENHFMDNFSVHYDTNPACPENEKFKALSLLPYSLKNKTELALYISSDGLKFTMKKILPIKGVFDTHNVFFWDEKEEIYKMYIRDFHDINGNDVNYEPTEAMNKAIRDVRLTQSKDFETWSTPEKIEFQEGAEDLQLYTNHIAKYHRANIYYGMPTRYIHRVRENEQNNFKYLPDFGGNRKKFFDEGSRAANAFTECSLMTSRDGFHFNRCDDAFLTPGLENVYNWIYGDCYVSYRLIETAIEGNESKTELSFFNVEGYHNKIVELVRYTVRLDGLFSWRGDFGGGSVLTNPIVFDGDSMNINFASSALGSIEIEVCSLDGTPIEGYNSGIIFGDSLNRPVDFEKPLSHLKGQEVRLRFSLKDCDLYSFEIK